MSDCFFQLKSAVEAVQRGTAVVIANGLKQGETILDIVKGKQVGTFITRNGHVELASTADHLADTGQSPPIPRLLVTPTHLQSVHIFWQHLSPHHTHLPHPLQRSHVLLTSHYSQPGLGVLPCSA